MNDLIDAALSRTHKQEYPNPTTASIDALRQAVVAQTALLRELSQQMRLSFEAQQAEYLSQQFEVAKQFEKLEKRLPTELFVELASIVDWVERVKEKLLARAKIRKSLESKHLPEKPAQRKAKR